MTFKITNKSIDSYLRYEIEMEGETYTISRLGTEEYVFNYYRWELLLSSGKRECYIDLKKEATPEEAVKRLLGLTVDIS